MLLYLAFHFSPLSSLRRQIKKLQEDNENIELELQGISEEERFLEEYAGTIKKPQGNTGTFLI